MTWVLAVGTPVALAGCLFAGVWPGDRGVTFLRCWWKIRYATDRTELLVGILGLISAIALYVVNGMARLVILFGGILGIVSSVGMDRTGGLLPTYRTPRTEKEIEDDGKLCR